MRSMFFVSLLAAASLSTPALTSAQTNPTEQTPGQGAPLDAADRKFLNDAAMGGLLEVKLGQQAAKQALHEDVKKFGQRMVEDHGKINADLAKVAQQKGITPPSELDKNHQSKVDKLSKLSGAEFDKAYVNEMVDDHKHDVDAFEKASKDAKDPGVKAFATNALPTLREHLTQAKDIQERLKGEKKP